ncbi:hypothetical protein [Streptomonospora wellingtoniae]|uniref:Uncharacterized protein n=1 Tax=Streptomonospora wellingtoniae TaxID=3075544 RepID=A0ABU2KQ77_9ACTN|nr:hypothetical protein [Streptomonospora sp. DSM 45055]MDT0301426.1 hypothetical protein [Streptomonospora sp. DSM 45055]
MKLTLLAKDKLSGAKGCPSVYVADTGDLVVQGVELTDSEMSAIQNPLDGEVAVRIDPEIVIEAIERFRHSETA